MKNVIALVDCDSFFVACEQVKKPELIGLPVCVLSNNDGCVVSRSREAKIAGVKMGMPYFMAKREFPEVIYLSGNKDLYCEISEKVMNKLKTYSPYVEVYSIDEAFIDLTGTTRLYNKNYEEIIRMIRSGIKSETGITVSIGLATSKTLAKLGSDKAKNTGGIFVVKEDELDELLKNTAIEEIWGIGRRLKKTLIQRGILNAYDFVSKPDSILQSMLGVVGLNLKHELMGECTSSVNSQKEIPKSIQHTSALKEFSTDKNMLKSELNKHIHSACSKLRRYGLLTANVGVMLRTKDFQVTTQNERLTESTNFELEIQKTVFELFEKIYKPGIIYRSTGVYLGDFEAENAKQLNLLNSGEEKNNNLAKCIDRIEAKFGKNSIRTGF